MENTSLSLSVSYGTFKSNLLPIGVDNAIQNPPRFCSTLLDYVSEGKQRDLQEIKCRLNDGTESSKPTLPILSILSPKESPRLDAVYGRDLKRETKVQQGCCFTYTCKECDKPFRKIECFRRHLMNHLVHPKLRAQSENDDQQLKGNFKTKYVDRQPLAVTNFNCHRVRKVFKDKISK